MSYIVKNRGERSRPILADYTCPVHGVFELLVDRDDNGEAPDAIECPIELLDFSGDPPMSCGERSTWTPSVIDSRVRKVEVVRGKWEKPERPTYYDTRDLGEGQDIDEWRDARRAKWDEQRKRDVYEMAKDA